MLEVEHNEIDHSPWNWILMKLPWTIRYSKAGRNMLSALKYLPHMHEAWINWGMDWCVLKGKVQNLLLSSNKRHLIKIAWFKPEVGEKYIQRINSRLPNRSPEAHVEMWEYFHPDLRRACWYSWEFYTQFFLAYESTSIFCMSYTGMNEWKITHKSKKINEL